MKNWLQIGKFSARSGLSPRALRVYEQLGLIHSHTRGENGYRYYLENQLEKAARIKQLKGLGFTLGEIKALLQLDAAMDCEKLKALLQKRLGKVEALQADLAEQKNQLAEILSSLEQNPKVLNRKERRYIVSQTKNVSVVVTGIKDLESTARHICHYLFDNESDHDFVLWQQGTNLPGTKPQVIILPEHMLRSPGVEQIQPDIVVIRDLSEYSQDIETKYLRLYTDAGPHMTTVFNADDRLSVQLAANETIRKGRTFYFSKNSGLEDQIKSIGGVVSHGDEIKIHHFNLTAETLHLRLPQVLGFDREVALLSALAAVMDIGLDRKIFASLHDECRTN